MPPLALFGQRRDAAGFDDDEYVGSSEDDQRMEPDRPTPETMFQELVEMVQPLKCDLRTFVHRVWDIHIDALANNDDDFDLPGLIASKVPHQFKLGPNPVAEDYGLINEDFYKRHKVGLSVVLPCSS